MAFGAFVQTNFGRQLDAKHYAGKGLHFSRLSLGDGDIGTSSEYDVTELNSEKLSLLIDAVSITEDEAIVTASLQSSLVDTGFNLREMGLMATDPDTGVEGAYFYNRDSSAGEYIPDKNSSTKLSEYLRVRCKVVDTQNITFEASGNPLYVTHEELSTEVSGQISNLAGEGRTTETVKANADAIAAHVVRTDNPHQVTAEQVGAESLYGSALETLTSPTQLTRPGKWSIGAMTANVNADADTQMTDYAVGDFKTLLLSTNVSADQGCQYGELIVSSPRLPRVLWIGQIWDYKFQNWQSTLSADIAKYAPSVVNLPSPGLRNHVMIPKTDSIPTGLADGTIVDRYEP